MNRAHFQREKDQSVFEKGDDPIRQDLADVLGWVFAGCGDFPCYPRRA
jgi:hypothetical protein